MKNKKMHTIISVIITAVGLVLMAGKIYSDSEPGAIPLALVLLGIGWYVIPRFRFRQRQK